MEYLKISYTTLEGDLKPSRSGEADMLGRLPNGNCTDDRRGPSRAMFSVAIGAVGVVQCRRPVNSSKYL